MARKEKFIECRYKKTDCFGEWKGLCIPLAGMSDKPECPFYKPLREADPTTERLVIEAIERMEKAE